MTDKHNELVDEWKRRQKGYLIKLNHEKAFDKVDWTFLDNILEAKNISNLESMDKKLSLFS